MKNLDTVQYIPNHIQTIIERRDPEQALQVLCDIEDTQTEARATLLEIIIGSRHASWVYHALILVPNLSHSEMDKLIEVIVEQHSTSWANRAIAELKKTLSKERYKEVRLALLVTFSR